jgi:hypothetical protein
LLYGGVETPARAGLLYQLGDRRPGGVVFNIPGICHNIGRKMGKGIE